MESACARCRIILSLVVWRLAILSALLTSLLLSGFPLSHPILLDLFLSTHTLSIGRWKGHAEQCSQFLVYLSASVLL
ncbi:hypothetical protein B0H13DRAFT_2097451 [Mycena leptocephala]|nr:hypothetical protein B0H13DRAFT_2097451 [Mycena leptocephala]